MPADGGPQGLGARPIRGTVGSLGRLPDSVTLPAVALATLPTPVERLEALGKALHHVDLWVKRDDLTGHPYGGNKIRKLELLLGQALADGATCVATVGAVGSNHVLATAIHARQLGLRCTAITFPRPITPPVTRTILATASVGARFVHLPTAALVPCAIPAVRAMAKLRGERMTWIAGGGSSPVGTVGYVGAALELAAQVRAGQLPEPAWIYVALGSGGTAAGLAAGLRLAGLATRIRAVRVVPGLVIGPRRVAALANETLDLLAASGLPHAVPRVRAADIDVVEDQLGAGYGHATRGSSAAVRLVRDLEAVPVEETYTGKTIAALVVDLGSGRVAPEEVALFWSTYGGNHVEELVVRDAVRLLPRAIRRSLPWV